MLAAAEAGPWEAKEEGEEEKAYFCKEQCKLRKSGAVCSTGRQAPRR